MEGDDLVQRRRSAGKADRTVKTYAGVVRAMWRWAEAAELVDRSPWRAVDLPTRTRDARPRVHATLGDLDRLGDALGEDYRAVVWLGMLGLRAQEMFGLRRGDLVLIEGRATLTVARTVNDVRGRLVEGDGKSTASARTIALPESVRADLAAWLGEHDRLNDPETYVLQAPRGGPVRYPVWRSRVWVPATEAAGLGGLVPHALRHLAIAAMREAGIPLDVASQRVGHSDMRTTLAHYGRLPDAVNREAADRLDALLSAQSGARIGAISARRRGVDPATSGPASGHLGGHGPGDLLPCDERHLAGEQRRSRAKERPGADPGGPVLDEVEVVRRVLVAGQVSDLHGAVVVGGDRPGQGPGLHGGEQPGGGGEPLGRDGLDSARPRSTAVPMLLGRTPRCRENR